MIALRWWDLALALGTALLLLWLALLITLLATHARREDMANVRESLRLLPDVIRLLRRLAGDPALPRGVRLRLGLALAYLLLPIDLVPDLIPVIGYADDVLIIALVLRSVVRRAGVEALSRHWPGSPTGLDLVRRLASVPTLPAPQVEPSDPPEES